MQAKREFVSSSGSSGLLCHLLRRLAARSPVSQQVSVQVGFARIALGTVNAGVWANAAVRQHVFL